MSSNMISNYYNYQNCSTSEQKVENIVANDVSIMNDIVYPAPGPTNILIKCDDINKTNEEIKPKRKYCKSIKQKIEKQLNNKQETKKGNISSKKLYSTVDYDKNIAKYIEVELGLYKLKSDNNVINDKQNKSNNNINLKYPWVSIFK